MQKLYFLCSALLFSLFSFAQAPVLFGLLKGYDNEGKLVRYDGGSNTLVSIFDFNSDVPNGHNPYGSLLLAGDGNLYGMTREGGTRGQGVIFLFNPAQPQYKKLYDFDSTNGAKPYGSLIQAANGMLYGMASEGGAYGKGVIFSFEPTSGTFTKLADFDSTNGASPYGSLLQASDGNLYGLTKSGGSNNRGVMFSYNLATGVYTKLHDFTGSPNFMEWSLDGAEPYGSLIQASDGLLYGLTSTGGLYYLGTTFSYDIATGTYAKIYDYEPLSSSGYYIFPHGSFVEASNKKLYGLNTGGGATTSGNIFESAYAGSSSSNIKAFSEYMDGYPNGQSPRGSLMQASDGKLYGTATSAFFSVDPETKAYTKVYDLRNLGNNYNYGHFTEWKCATPITVSIADAKALPRGVDANTVYRGYMPASYITLTAEVPNGDGQYTYQWSNGATTPTIKVSPGGNTKYSVTVTTSGGCSGTATKEIKVVDVRCGNTMEKVMLCKTSDGAKAKNKTLCLGQDAVAAQLASGAMLGSCDGKGAAVNDLSISATPNPSTNYFMLQIQSANTKDRIALRVMNTMGRIMEVRMVNAGQFVQVGGNYPAGTYYAEVLQGATKASVKLLKTVY